MQPSLLSADAKEQFDRDGFLLVPELLDAAEAELLRQVARADREVEQERSSRADGEGGSVDLLVRNGDTVKAGDVVMTVHAETPGELAYALSYLTHHPELIQLDGTGAETPR